MKWRIFGVFFSSLLLGFGFGLVPCGDLPTSPCLCWRHLSWCYSCVLVDEVLYLEEALVFMGFFSCVLFLGLSILPWCLALGFGDLLGDCISWMEDPSLVLCIVCWISSLSIMHWDLEIFPWLVHWDLWSVLILRFVIWSHGFLCSSLVWWPPWDCWRSLRVSSGRNLIRFSWRET